MRDRIKWSWIVVAAAQAYNAVHDSEIEPLKQQIAELKGLVKPRLTSISELSDHGWSAGVCSLSSFNCEPCHPFHDWRVVLTEEAKLVELERKIGAIMRGLNLLLFEEGELLPDDEVEELKARLEDYVKGKRFEFVKLDKP